MLPRKLGGVSIRRSPLSLSRNLYLSHCIYGCTTSTSEAPEVPITPASDPISWTSEQNVATDHAPLRRACSASPERSFAPAPRSTAPAPRPRSVRAAVRGQASRFGQAFFFFFAGASTLSAALHRTKAARAPAHDATQ